jgi:hypothetical protein
VCKAPGESDKFFVPKKLATRLSPYKSRIFALLWALAHNLVHNKCAEVGMDGGLLSAYAAA